MVRTVKRSAIVGTTSNNHVTGEVLMANGEQVFVLNRTAHASALRAADGRLMKILREIRSSRPKSSVRS